MLTLDAMGPLDKLVDLVPDVINKTSNIIKKSTKKPDEVLKIKEEKKIDE